MKIPLFLRNLYFRYCFRVTKGKCLFVPHPGFIKQDKASIINYKADNCLIFVRYLLENELCLNKELVVVSTTPERAHKEQEWCREHYPKANIRFIPNISRPFMTEWASSEYIISSEAIFQYRKKKHQKYIVLGYYPVATKIDWFDPTKSSVYQKRLSNARQIDMIMSASLIYSQMDSSQFEVSFGKFVPIGRCRSDVMLQKEDVSYVRDYFHKLCPNYKFSKIILYPPTHRDYERSEFDIKRSILGFEVNIEHFEKFLEDNEILIVCKLHPAQNKEVVDMQLPRGVINFTGCEDFGLVELMKSSDMLMTDYSSAYMDYLLLDKPVIFNFYDFETYDKTRGLSFHPFERICAGKAFRDEESFYEAVTHTLKSPDEYKDKRSELIEEFHTHRDHVCEKTYKEIFEK